MTEPIDFNSARRQHEPQRGGIDAAAIKARIDPRSFVGWLFSGRAICSRKDARIGSVDGEAGESLCVTFDTGLWFDHATDEGGDLISLYMRHMGYRDNEFGRALREIAVEFLGDNIPIDKPFRVKERIAEKKAKLGDKPKAINLELGAPVENYGYYDRANKVLCVERRYELDEVDPATGKRKKTYRVSRTWPNPRPLYRIPQIIGATHVVLTEGARKAEALAELGIEATAVLGGANTKLEMVDWTPIAGKHVTIWPDKDTAGDGFAKRVTPLLINLGCTVRVVTPPADKPNKWDAYDCIQENGDPHAILRGAEAANGEALRVLTVAALFMLPPTTWLIRNWLPENALGFIYGDPGCGKSFLALDWALHLAYGCTHWCGEKVITPGPVFYICQEGGRGIADRIAAWKRYHGIVDNPTGLEFTLDQVSFLDRESMAKVEATIRARVLNFRLIIVDTVSRVLPGAEENLQKEMTLFISACDRLRGIGGATVLGAHHASKAGDMRGSTVLRGAGDFVFKLEKERGVNPISATCEKLKDEEDGWQRALKMEKVKLEDREDTDFNPVKSSLVITGMDDGPIRYERAEMAVLKCIELAGRAMTSKELQEATGLSRGHVHRVLDKLVEEKKLTASENARGRTYS